MVTYQRTEPGFVDAYLDAHARIDNEVRQLVPSPRQSHGSHDVWHWFAGFGSAPLRRKRQGVALDEQIQILLLNHVLGTDLACWKSASTDPAADRFGVLSRKPSSFWDC